jgi:hypothetical protein
MTPRILLVDGIGRTSYYTELRAALDAEWLTELTPALEHAGCSAIDLAIVSQENHAPTSIALCRLIERGVPTLCLMDGISEWRFVWSRPPGDLRPPRHQPVLSHKVACIGRSQARLLESWGNVGKCEVVGLPRLDALRGRQARRPKAGQPVRLLITTAKTPAFTAEELQRVEQSLRDLKAWLDRARGTSRLDVEPVWRLTFELATRIGVANQLSDDTGRELARVLTDVDAMVTTPSTCMLEGMLQSVPVALLDYNNCPHYVPAAWCITAPSHLDDVVPALVNPPAAGMLYQDTILHDALECRTPAMPRLVRLIGEMIRLARECRQDGRPIGFPRRILPDEQDGHHAPEPRFDLAALYPDPGFGELMERRALLAEIGHLRDQHRQDQQALAALRDRLARRDPAAWVRAVSRLLVPRRLRSLAAPLRRPARYRLPSWAERAPTPARAARRDGERPDA